MDSSRFSSLLIFLIGNYFLTLLIVGLLAGVISLLNKAKPLSIDTVGEALFSYYLLFAIGISNLVNFVFHVFLGDMAAEFIGWKQSPFQAEVGFASLGIGIAGVIAFSSKLTISLRYADSAFCFLVGSSGRSHLSDDSCS